MKLVKQNKYKGTLKASVLKSVLALGLVGTMLTSFSACGSEKEKNENIFVDEMDYLITYVKDFNNNLQGIVLDPKEKNYYGITPETPAIGLFEYSTNKMFEPYTDPEDLKKNWESIIAENTASEYVDTIELKPLLVAEYGYKVEYTVNEIDELITKIKQEPGKYIEEASNVKSKVKSTE